MKVIVRAIRESSRVSRALYGAAMDIRRGVWSLLSQAAETVKGRVKAFMESSRAVYRAVMDVRGGVWSLLGHSGEAAD
jgi:hypothetical protein